MDQTAAQISRLIAQYRIEFGQRLLARSNGEVIRFRDFVTVAREFVDFAPDHVPTFLAGLVALDITNDAKTPPAAPPAPGRN